MGKKTEASPDFATRKEAAVRLNLSTRQIDRLCRDGTLPKVRTSGNRSAIPRHVLEDYIRQAMNGAIVSVPAGTKPYSGTGSPCVVLDIEVPDDNPLIRGALDFYLAQTHPGILIGGSGRLLHLVWSWSLGYEPLEIRALLENLDPRDLLE
jgi:excisionase family DNA binding protein